MRKISYYLNQLSSLYGVNIWYTLWITVLIIPPSICWQHLISDQGHVMWCWGRASVSKMQWDTWDRSEVTRAHTHCMNTERKCSFFLAAWSISPSLRLIDVTSVSSCPSSMFGWTSRPTIYKWELRMLELFLLFHCHGVVEVCICSQGLIMCFLL